MSEQIHETPPEVWSDEACQAWLGRQDERLKGMGAFHRNRIINLTMPEPVREYQHRLAMEQAASQVALEEDIDDDFGTADR